MAKKKTQENEVVSFTDELIAEFEDIEGITFNEETKTIPTHLHAYNTISGGGVPIGKLILLVGAAGGGKCFASGTEILMYDGHVKKVEDIEIGDFVMGDDSSPRKVLRTTSGIDEMYDVTIVSPMDISEPTLIIVISMEL